MRVRFQADADLNQIIVAAMLRREPSVDVRSASAAGLAGLPDPEVLRLAADDGRVLLTHDRTTMPRFFSEFIREHPSPGLIVIPQHLGLPLVVEELLLVWAATEPEEWRNRICFLPL